MADSYGSGYRAGEEWSEDHATEEQLIRVADFAHASPKARGFRIEIAMELGDVAVPFAAWLSLIWGEHEPGFTLTDESRTIFEDQVRIEGGCESLEHGTKYVQGFCMGVIRARGVVRVGCPLPCL